MNIKKIIREEVDDFDWIRDTTHVLHPGKKYKTPSGNIVTIEEYREGYLRWSVFNVSSKYTYTQERRTINAGKNMIGYVESGEWVLIP